MAFNYWQTLKEGNFYHLYNRSINKELLFRKDSDYYLFLTRIKKYFSPYLDIYAYCLMPDHFHFLIRVKKVTESVLIQIKTEKTVAGNKLVEKEITINDFIEDQFRRLFSSYALWYNKYYKRTGSLFQKRPKRILIKSEIKLLQLICYIHHNPIHHGFAEDYSQWIYSSFNAFLSDQPTALCRNKVFEWFGLENIELGKELFLQHHQSFKYLPSELSSLD